MNQCRPLLYVVREQASFDHKDLNLLDWGKRSTRSTKSMSNDSLEGRIPLVTLRIDDDDPIPDFFYSGGLPVVSSRLRAILLLFRTHVEFLDVKIQPPSARPHWFLNVMKVVDAVDEEKSVIRRSANGVVSRINELELKPDAIDAAAPLFRVKKFEWLVLVTEELRGAMDMANITNVRFTPYWEYQL